MFELTDGEYWRDGVIMGLVDEVPDDAVSFAIMQSETGAEFNNAIWGFIRLRDIVEKYYSKGG